MFLIVLSVSAWSQLSVKNHSGEEVMTVDDNANVTIGSSLHNGNLTTHTITIKEGAVNGRVLKSNASGEASWGTLPLNAVLDAGNDADGNDAVNFDRIGVGINAPDSRFHVNGHKATSTISWGTMNTTILARDLNSNDNESAITILGVNDVMISDNDRAHVGVQGLLVGGSSKDTWVVSGGIAHYDLTEGHNNLAAFSCTVKEEKQLCAPGVQTFLLRGQNYNSGDEDYGIHIQAVNNVIDGDLIVTGNSSFYGTNPDPSSYELYINGAVGVQDGIAVTDGNIWVSNQVSAQVFEDRTPYPQDLQTAYESVLSMQRLPQGAYRPDDKRHQLDHSKLHPFIQSADGEQRDLSATVSAQNEVIKDLLQRIENLEALLDVATAE